MYRCSAMPLSSHIKVSERKTLISDLHCINACILALHDQYTFDVIPTGPLFYRADDMNKTAREGKWTLVEQVYALRGNI